jgi:hypothetical protein
MKIFFRITENQGFFIARIVKSDVVSQEIRRQVLLEKIYNFWGIALIVQFIDYRKK